MELRRAAIARITANSVFAFSIFLVALASIFFAEGSHVQAAAGGSSPAPLSAADPPCPSRSHLPERLFPAHLSR